MAMTDPKGWKEDYIHFPGWLSNLDVTKSLWIATFFILKSWAQHLGCGHVTAH